MLRSRETRNQKRLRHATIAFNYRHQAGFIARAEQLANTDLRYLAAIDADRLRQQKLIITE